MAHQQIAEAVVLLGHQHYDVLGPGRIEFHPAAALGIAQHDHQFIAGPSVIAVPLDLGAHVEPSVFTVDELAIANNIEPLFVERASDEMD